MILKIWRGVAELRQPATAERQPLVGQRWPWRGSQRLGPPRQCPSQPPYHHDGKHIYIHVSMHAHNQR